MELTIDQTLVIATGNGETDTATGYLHSIGARAPWSAHVWTCGANLAQWKGFTDNRYWLAETVSDVLYWSNVDAFPVSEYPDDAYSRRNAQAFDY